MRTKTLVKGSIILIDAHPFKSWYESHYGRLIGVKKGSKIEAEEVREEQLPVLM